MNQILYTETKKKEKKHSKWKIALLLIAICAVILGGFFIGKLIFVKLNDKEIEEVSEPLIQISQEGNELSVVITHDKPIEKIAYKWGNGQEEVLSGESKEEVEQTIYVPAGTNNLTLKVTDNIGKTVTYSEEYTGEDGDTKKPEIQLTVEGQKVKITVTDETALEYMQYYWNDEDETEVDASSDDTKKIEENVDILKGENTLTVKAVDLAGNTNEVQQKYRGSKKPKIDVRQEEKNIVISVADDQGIQKIDYNLNGVFYSSDPQGTGAPLGRTEVEFKQQLDEGENKIEITVTNVDGLDAKFTWEGTSN